MHALLNAVCEPEGVGAGSVDQGARATRRGGADGRASWPRARAEQGALFGPGKLTQALGVTLADNGQTCESGPVVISGRPERFSDPVVQRDRRIGITKAAELPWRFCLAGSRYLSVPVRNPL